MFNALVMKCACLLILGLTLAPASHAQDDVWWPKESKSLYKDLGGVHQVAAIVDAFGMKASMEPTMQMNEHCKTAFSKGMRPFFNYNMTGWLCQAWGGPQKYMGPDMVAWHRAAHISDAEWAAGSKIFATVLNDMKVKPDVQKRVGEFFMDFRRQMTMDGTMEVMMPMADKSSLYTRLGGTPAIAAVVDEFVNRLATDPTVTGNKNVVKSLSMGKVSGAGIKYLVTEQLVLASGGPAKYSGRDMASSHKGLMITEGEWEQSAKILKSVLDDFKVPAKEQGEVFAAIVATKKDIVGK